MFFALETYWPRADGIGAARIEEEVVVTADGCEVVTKFPAEDLLIAGPRYIGVNGTLPVIRSSQSHLNTTGGGARRDGGPSTMGRPSTTAPTTCGSRRCRVPERRPGEVLLRVLRSGMCGTDATEWKAGPLTFPVDRVHPVTGSTGPMIFGHEFIGEVVEVGTDAAFRTGAVVASGAGVWCGACDRCREGRTNLCRRYYTLGLNTAGGLAEYVAVPEITLVAGPDGLDLDAAGLAQPLAVGLHAARRSGARDGDRVVLIGAGAIGTFVLTGLRHLADVDMTVVDFPGHRLDRAARLGATRRSPSATTSRPASRPRSGPAARTSSSRPAGPRPARHRDPARPRRWDDPPGRLPGEAAGGGRARARDAGDHRAHDARARLRRGPGDRRCDPRRRRRSRRSCSTRCGRSAISRTSSSAWPRAGSRARSCSTPNCRRHRYEGSGLPRSPRRPRRGRPRAVGARPGRGDPAPLLLRDLRHRPARVRDGPDRHPRRTAPPERIGAPADPRPRVLGEIVAVGAGVTGLKEGQRVSVMPLLSCGTCYYCRRGLNHLCIWMACVGLSYAWGGIADLAVVPASHVTRAAGCGLRPAGRARRAGRRRRVRRRHRAGAARRPVLITGAGPIGALAALYAASLGADVTISEVNPCARRLAASLGVGEVVDPSKVDVAAMMKDAPTASASTR